MELGLKDKVVLVTGSSRGIGRVIAGSFLEAGAKVALTGRDDNALKKAYGEFASRLGQGSLMSAVCDLTDAEGIAGCLKAIEQKWGGIDILVANIGSGRLKSGLEPDKDDWMNMLDINLIGASLVVKYAVPLMIKRGGGSIVFISSIAGIETLPAPIPYSAAKAGLIAASKNLSRLLAPENIRVNVVAPGNILAPGGVWERKLGEDAEGVKQYINSEVPMKRLGRPEEVADAVLFLSSERASFITGSCLVVDGGQTRGF
ncbi:MAG: SDR family NAD(P)-dependent oxidoreductase [Thermodesulfovibrionales bacterium]|nr:SDR family NAD(P)-dependent oxidoreductase [Thermodesulfovibrionales bacterium]